MAKVTPIKMHIPASSLDGGTGTRHYVIPTIHAILRVGTPGENSDDVSLIVQNGVRRPTQKGVKLEPWLNR
jgi:hypothetical protein